MEQMTDKLSSPVWKLAVWKKSKLKQQRMKMTEDREALFFPHPAFVPCLTHHWFQSAPIKMTHSCNLDFYAQSYLYSVYGSEWASRKCLCLEQTSSNSGTVRLYQGSVDVQSMLHPLEVCDGSCIQADKAASDKAASLEPWNVSRTFTQGGRSMTSHRSHLLDIQNKRERDLFPGLSRDKATCGFQATYWREWQRLAVSNSW